MRLICRAILICTFFCGCTTTRNLQSPLDANRGPITDKADIILRSGEIIEATDIHVGFDTTRFLRQWDDTYGYVSTNTIHQLRVTDRFAGSVGGFVGGSLGGLCAGILAAKIAGVAPHGEAAMGNIPWLLGGIMIGSAYGAVYGWDHGYQKHYIFPSDTTVNRKR